MKIFDVNAHPTLDGKFLSKTNSTFNEWVESLDQTAIQSFCAVSVPNTTESRDAEEYISVGSKFSSGPFIHGLEASEFTYDRMAQLRDMGYSGVKIHPRFSSTCVKTAHQSIADVFEAAVTLDMVVYFCSMTGCSVSQNTFSELHRDFISCVGSLQKIPRIVIAHAGYFDILKWSELARFNKDIFIDLSYTQCYAIESSIRMDMQFLAKTLDKKILVGSDFPEFQACELQESVEVITHKVSQEKKNNITWNNAIRLFKLE